MKKASKLPAPVLEKVANIYSLCLQINALGKFNSFYSYSGHVSALNVSVQLIKGVSDESEAVALYDSMEGLDNYLTLDKPYTCERLDKCITRLEEIRNECIPNTQPIKLTSN